MALVKEDGSTVSGANTYASIVDADSYHTDRANAPWLAATTAQKTAALIYATTYVDRKYINRLKGQRVKPAGPTAQALEWPRIGVRLVDQPQYYYNVVPSFYDIQYAGYVGITEIPPDLIAAVCEGALAWVVSGPLAPNITPADRVVREKIDVIETQYAVKDFTTCYQIIDQLMSRFLKSPADAVRG